VTHVILIMLKSDTSEDEAVRALRVTHVILLNMSNITCATSRAQTD
jgi:hypothetical protein